MIFNIVSLKPPQPSDKGQKPFNPLPLFGLLLFLAVAFLIGTKWLESDQEGNPILAPYRKAKLEKELEELDKAEQYALLAARDGDYPCFNCPGKSTIFLRQGQVWKYGVTTKGEKSRYGTWHIDNNLFYVIQLEGTLQECLREEKRKIYYYATLPENLARPVPLIRPPGNKQDN